jgi:seryl-tRNA synthetase
MLDRQFVRNNPDATKRGVADKGYDASVVDSFLDADEKLRAIETQLSAARHERKAAAEARDAQRGTAAKAEVRKLEEAFGKAKDHAQQLLMGIPNLAFGDVEVGSGETANRVIRHWGEPKVFEFKPCDHIALAKQLDLYDFDRGAKVAGSKFYYTKNQAVMLELALLTYVSQKAVANGYELQMTPDLARSRFYTGTGYMPKGDEAQTYVVEGEDLGLIATAEVTLAGQFADEVLNEGDLPAKYLGISHAFRREQGAYGRYSNGLYRVHQFTKAELFTFCRPEDSQRLHLEMLGVEEEIYQELGIPYRVIEMGTGDLGAMAARKFDIEAWMPGRNDYGEVTSASNCTDFQARNLNVRFRKATGEIDYVHMLNGTAIAMSRVPIAILENFQRADGSVEVPDVLRPYIGLSEIRRDV